MVFRYVLLNYLDLNNISVDSSMGSQHHNKLIQFFPLVLMFLKFYFLVKKKPVNKVNLRSKGFLIGISIVIKIRRLTCKHLNLIPELLLDPDMAPGALCT